MTQPDTKTKTAAIKAMRAFIENYWKLSDRAKIVFGKPDKAGFRSMRLKKIKREYPKAMRILMDVDIDGKSRRFEVAIRDVMNHYNLKK